MYMAALGFGAKKIDLGELGAALQASTDAGNATPNWAAYMRCSDLAGARSVTEEQLDGYVAVHTRVTPRAPPPVACLRPRRGVMACPAPWDAGS